MPLDLLPETYRVAGVTTTLPPDLLAWLYLVLTAQYRHADLAYHHAATLLATARWRPQTKPYHSSHGNVALLLNLSGTVPASIGGNVYHIPLELWLPLDYPQVPPEAFVAPTATMRVVPGNHVGVDGRFYHRMLSEWGAARAEVRGGATPEDLLRLVAVMSECFSREPPVAAQTAPPQPSVAATNTPAALSTAAPITSTKSDPSQSSRESRGTTVETGRTGGTTGGATGAPPLPPKGFSSTPAVAHTPENAPRRGPSTTTTDRPLQAGGAPPLPPKPSTPTAVPATPQTAPHSTAHDSPGVHGAQRSPPTVPVRPVRPVGLRAPVIAQVRSQVGETTVEPADPDTGPVEAASASPLGIEAARSFRSAAESAFAAYDHLSESQRRLTQIQQTVRTAARTATRFEAKLAEGSSAIAEGIHEAARQALEGSAIAAVDVDLILATETVVFGQLYDVVCEGAALEDTIGALEDIWRRRHQRGHRESLLNSPTPLTEAMALDPDRDPERPQPQAVLEGDLAVFVRAVRELAREQFYKKALEKRIVRVVGLALEG